MASGVSTGNTPSRKKAASAARRGSLRVATGTIEMRAAFSAGSSSSFTSRYRLATKMWARCRIDASCWDGVRPARSGVVVSSSTSRRTAATRTMKNSSRFDDAMAANLIRSSSGVEGSAASSSTRSLKASHESSRLKKRARPGGHEMTLAGRTSGALP